MYVIMCQYRRRRQKIFPAISFRGINLKTTTCVSKDPVAFSAVRFLCVLL